MPPSSNVSVVIAGGGLAGLSCALSLGRAGFDVTLCEAAAQFGGKASAVAPTTPDHCFPLPVEHGPHFFAAWYRNLLALMEQLGISQRLIDFDGYDYLLPSTTLGHAGRQVHVTVSARSVPLLARAHLANLRHGPLPWPVTLQSASLLLDLLTMRAQAGLDELSIHALVRSRWYGDQALAEEAHEQILRAASVPSALASAQSMSRLVQQWFRHPSPFLSVLDTDIASGLIDPLAREVSRVAQLHLDAPVAELIATEHHITGVRLRDGTAVHADLTVAATPLDVTQRWVQNEVHALEPRLTMLHRLNAAPMASFQLAFRTSLRNVPPGVVYLLDSSPSINLIDLTQTWRELPQLPGTVLSLVISDYGDLRHLTQTRQVELLVAELGRYLPDATIENLSSVAVRTNVGAPLFLNTVGSWASRPHPEEAYAGRRDGDRSNSSAGSKHGGRLYLTGDYTQTPVDLACMESAVLAGLLTARAIARRHGRAPGIEPLIPDALSAQRRAAYQLLKLSLVAPTAVGRIATKLTRSRADRSKRQQPS